MAINPEPENSGALALAPRRVNIFAKLDAAEGSSRSQPETIFDAAAACQTGVDDERHEAVAPWGHRATVHVRRGIARLFGLTGLSLVITVLALRPEGPAIRDPSHSQPPRRETTPHGRGAPTGHARAKNTVQRPRTHKRAKPHRAPRQRRNPAVAPPRPIQRPAPVGPRRAPSLPAPRRTAPARPLPMRVPQSAPPEFM